MDIQSNLLLFAVFLLWCTGGILIVLGAFNLRKREYIIVGIVTGMIASNWFTNIFHYFLGLVQASILAAFVTLLLGLALNFTGFKKSFPKISPSLGVLVVFAFVTVAFTLINRGLAIFDDFQNLPIVSLLGANYFPLHFALDPAVRFGYHYFLLLFAAQLMRLGSFYPWSALDLAHGLMLASALTLAYLWLKRMTRNTTLSFLGVVFIAFASGARWLLLFVPTRFAAGFVNNVHLLGTGAFSGSDIFNALVSPWVMKQGGPIPFPFAFEDGIMNSLTMSLTGIGSANVVVMLLLLITYRHWRGWRGAFITIIFIASLALLVEADFALYYLAFGIVFLGFWIYTRRIKISPALTKWIVIGGISAVLAAVQGGVLTELLYSKLSTLFSATPEASYFGFTFTFHATPIILSSQLGELSFTNPYQFITALAEIGPLFFVFPLVILWGWKMFKFRRWFEAAVAVLAAISLGSLFVSYEGIAGDTAVTRLFTPFLYICRLYFVPLGWIWLRKRKEWLQITGLSIGLITVISGMVLFGIQMIAVQRPVYSYFIRDLDAVVAEHYWDRLETEALIFDPNPYRTPVIFGRYTKAGNSLVEFSPEWYELQNEPDPYALNAYGFTYVYLDEPYWEKLSPTIQAKYSDTCVKVVFEYTGYRNVPLDYGEDFRKLLDIRNCHK